MSTNQLSRDEAVELIESLTDRVDGLEEQRQQMLLEQAQDRQRITALERENESLRERVADLERRVTPNPAAKDYGEKDRPEKVHELRVSLARKATSNGGLASMDYNNVLALFNQHPSDGYAYKLMKLAADHDEETRTSHYDGFEYRSFEDRNDQLRVNLDDVNDDAVLHAVNNGSSNGGGR